MQKKYFKKNFQYLRTFIVSPSPLEFLAKERALALGVRPKSKRVNIAADPLYLLTH